MLLRARFLGGWKAVLDSRRSAWVHVKVKGRGVRRVLVLVPGVGARVGGVRVFDHSSGEVPPVGA